MSRPVTGPLELAHEHAPVHSSACGRCLIGCCGPVGSSGGNGQQTLLWAACLLCPAEDWESGTPGAGVLSSFLQAGWERGVCTGVVYVCACGVHMCVYSWHQGLGGFSPHTPGFRPALRPALRGGLGSLGRVFARPQEGVAQSLLLPLLVPLGADLRTDANLGTSARSSRWVDRKSVV